MKTIKKLLLLSASMTLLCGCNLLSLGGNNQQNNQNQQNQVELAKIVVSNYTKTVEVGATYHFNGTVLACYSDNSTNVVTDYSVGNVDTSKAGTVKFVVSYTENGKTVTATLTITVTSSGQGGDSEDDDDDDDEKVSVTGVALNKSEITLKVGGSETLIATVSPSNASNKSVSWSSSDDSVASVSANGAVSARKEGSAVITVTTADGEFTETCSVTVEKDEQGREEVSAEEAYQIMNTLGSGVVSDKEYYVRGIAKNIEIDSYGSMKGSFEGTQVTFESVKAKGIAENASDVEGKEIVILGYLELYNGSYKIGYLPPSVSPTGEKYNPSLIQIVDSGSGDDDTPIDVTGVTLSETTAEIGVGKTLTLTATVSPSNATNKNVSWSSSNESVATVSNGVVTAKAVGNATITVTTEDGSHTATCAVTVKEETTPPVGEKSTVYTFKNDKTSSQNMGTWTSAQFMQHVVVDGSEIITGIKDITNAYIGGNGGSGDAAWELWDCFKVGKSNASGKATLTLDNSKSFESIKIKAIGNRDDGTLTINSITKNVTKKAVKGDLEPIELEFDISGGISELTFSSKEATSNNYGIVITEIEFVGTEEGGSGSGGGGETETVSVTGVSLNKTTAEIKVGETLSLSATVSPSNASNKSVSWNSNNESVATVSNGTVTAKSKGTATITVTTADGGKTATCTVTVKETEVKPDIEGDGYKVEFKANSGDGSGALSGDKILSEITSGSDYVNSISAATNVFSGSKGLKFGSSKAGGSLEFTVTSAISSLSATGIKLGLAQYSSSNATVSLSVNGSEVGSGSSSDSEVVISLSSAKILKVNIASDTRFYLSSIEFVCGAAEPVSPTAISIPSSAEMSVNGEKQLTVTYTPSNANQNKGITWSSNNTSVATVDSNGNITAKAAGSAVITATLTSNTQIKATCSVTVNEKQASSKSAWTIMLYICGSNLEYNPGEQAGYASQDIEEILSAAIPQNPSDPAEKVNIIMQTGGIDKKGKWYLDAKTYIEGGTPISSSAEQRWEVKGSKLALKSTLSTNAISTQSHLADFIDWGLTNYEAERTALIMWDHGAGIGGCLNDKASGKYLKNSDITAATRTALSKHSDVDKMDFIAYDCCLMGCADIASVNADYYDYMVGSQESEFAGGYDYDEWLKVIKADPTGCTTLSVCDSIAQTFVQEQCYDYRDCDDCHQTNAVYDLSKMSKLVTDFNTFATSLSINSQTKFDTMCEEFEKCLAFGADSDGSLFGLCDFVDLINKLSAKYNVSGTEVINDIKSVVVKNYYCTEYSTVKPCGMNAFVAHAFDITEFPMQVSYDDYDGSDSTKFSVWQTMNQKYGEYYDSY